MNLCLPLQWSLQDTGKYTTEALLIWSGGLCVDKATARKEIASSSSAFTWKDVFDYLFRSVQELFIALLFCVYSEKLRSVAEKLSPIGICSSSNHSVLPHSSLTKLRSNNENKDCLL